MQCSATLNKLKDSTMMVQMDPLQRCDGCERTGGCGVQLFQGVFNRVSTELELPRLVGAKPGDHVMLEIPDSLALPLAFVGFLVPVLSMLVFALLGQTMLGTVGPNAQLVPIAGIAGFVGGLIAYRPLSSYVWTHARTPITAIRVLAQG